MLGPGRSDPYLLSRVLPCGNCAEPSSPISQSAPSVQGMVSAVVHGCPAGARQRDCQPGGLSWRLSLTCLLVAVQPWAACTAALYFLRATHTPGKLVRGFEEKRPVGLDKAAGPGCPATPRLLGEAESVDGAPFRGMTVHGEVGQAHHPQSSNPGGT